MISNNVAFGQLNIQTEYSDEPVQPPLFSLETPNHVQSSQ